jgi:hypothetical protein
VSVEHAAAVRDGVRGLDAEAVTDAADGLVALARCTDPVDVRKRLRDKAHAINDRLAAAAERRARQRMGLRLSDVGSHTAVDGTLAGAGRRDRPAGDGPGRRSRPASRGPARQSRPASRCAGRLGQRLPAPQHGPGDSLADDAHTVRTHLHVLCRPDQLAAAPDSSAPSLAELIRRDLTGDQHVAAAGIAGELGSLSRQALRRLACDATLDLVTLGPPTISPASLHVTGLERVRAASDDGDDRDDHRTTHRISPLSSASAGLIDVGRASRTVTGRQFRALIARDRRCVVKGCRRRPAQCAAHHVRHWADGGRTDLDNLVLLCHQHHHDHHDRQHDLPHRDGQRWLTQTGWRHAPP